MSATRREPRRDARLLAIAAGGAALGAAFAVSPSPIDQFGAIASASDALIAVARDVVGLGLRTAPALTAPILLALAFPLVAYLARAAVRSRRSREATRIYRRSLLPSDLAVDGDGEGRHGSAFLEVVGDRGGRFAISRDMMRIGREDDNDIRIPNAAVHRYHAAISRENLDEWRITDLSGLDGNGVIVNGRRCGHALLADGDVIQLGPGCLRFRAGTA